MRSARKQDQSGLLLSGQNNHKPREAQSSHDRWRALDATADGLRDILNHPSFRFGEAHYDPRNPAHGPWPAAKDHFRFILAPDFAQRILSEPDDLPRPWGQLLWVPESLAHTAISRQSGHHFWIMPKAPALEGVRLGDQRIVRLTDFDCVTTALHLYDEYLRGEEAMTMELAALGKTLLVFAERIVSRRRK